MRKKNLQKLASIPGIVSVQFVSAGKNRRDFITIASGSSHLESFKSYLLDTMNHHNLKYTRHPIRYLVSEAGSNTIWVINSKAGILLLEISDAFDSFDIEEKLVQPISAR